MPACVYAPASGETISRLIDFFDCQSRTLGAGGFQALAAAGSTASLLLAALLTILVALFGFRLLLGDTPTIRDLVLTFVKIGIVLAMTSSWPAYRTVVYDVIIQGPRQLAGEVSTNLDLPGTDGSLARRLDNIDREFATLEALGSGRYTAETAPLEQGALANSGLDRLGLGMSRAAFLLTPISAFAGLGLAAGLLLALGPLFVVFLLFSATRGLVEGWLRALASVLLATVMTIVALGVELAVFEPWMAALIGRRAGGETILAEATPLLATTTAFFVVMVALVLLSLRIGFSLRFPAALHRVHASIVRQAAPRTETILDAPSTTSGRLEGPTRASLIVGSIAAAQRREEHLHQIAAAMPGKGPGRTVLSSPSDGQITSSAPLGQSFRRTSRRVSSIARQRDRRT